MRAKLRRPDSLNSLAFGGAEADHAKEATKQRQSKPETGLSKDAPTLSIFYGSNTGTCESLASSLASSAAAHGFNSKVDILDKATEALPKNQPTVIITASYEGQPPDNAGRFVGWLEEEKTTIEGTKYAVFGCGNRKFYIAGLLGGITNKNQATGLAPIKGFRPWSMTSLPRKELLG